MPTIKKLRELEQGDITNIIQKHFKNNRTKVDGGLEESDVSDIECVHGDGPNEFLKRQRLLMASILSGQNNNVSEIGAIIEALKRSEIVE